MASELYVETLKGLTSGANANKVIVPAGQTLDASAGSVVLPAGAGGKVLQVLQATTTTDTSITTTTFTDTTLTGSITPSSTSSKILVLVTQNIYLSRSGSSATALVKLVRDSTDLQQYDYISIDNGVSTALALGNIFTFTYLDSPSTTSSVTYKTQGRTASTTNGHEARFQVTTDPSTITLMEIAG